MVLFGFFSAVFFSRAADVLGISSLLLGLIFLLMLSASVLGYKYIELDDKGISCRKGFLVKSVLYADIVAVEFFRYGTANTEFVGFLATDPAKTGNPLGDLWLTIRISSNWKGYRIWFALTGC